MTGRATPVASVIIPCRNAAPYLGAQLDALAEQRGPVPTEVIVVDDASTDGSAEIAAGFADRLPDLRVLRLDRARNAAAARNAGVAASQGRLLLFCDADDVVAEGWVAAMVEALSRHPIVGGPSEIERLNPDWLRQGRIEPQLTTLQPWGEEGWDLVHGGPGNLGLTRELYDDVGPLDESDELAVAEGVDYFFRAQLAGYEPAFAPDAVIHVRFRATLRSTYRQARGWAEGSVAIHRRYAAQGMPAPGWVRGLASWGLVPLRLLKVRNRGQFARWIHLLGWRVGRLRGSIRYRMLAF